jgi:exodeoxyribonuclease VII small subunit
MKKNIKFEDALKRLEVIVDQLESREPDLEKSLILFEEGIKLAQVCTAKLDETKKKIEILIKKGPKMVAQPYAESSESEEENTN